MTLPMELSREERMVNGKHEILNPKQIQMTKRQNTKQ